MEIENLVRTYLIWIENGQGKAKATVASQKEDLTLFVRYLKEEQVKLEEVDQIFLQGFLDSLSLRYQATSVSRLTSTLRSFFSYLNIFYGLKDPSTLLQAPKREKKLPVWAAGEEIDEILKRFDSSPKGILDKTIIMVLYCCGLRVSELCTLKLNDVRLNQKQIRVYGKGGKERMIPLVDACVEQMEIYSQTIRKPTGNAGIYFFVTAKGKPLNRQYVYRLVKTCALQENLSPNFSPHSLRHSYATRLIEKDTDLRLVQELLGHSDISTTQIYTHIDSTRLVDTIDRALPCPDLDLYHSLSGQNKDQNDEH